MLTTIQPPIRKEDIKRMKELGWIPIRRIDRDKPLHLFLDCESWVTLAIQDDAKVSFLTGINLKRLPETWVSQESETIIALAVNGFFVPMNVGPHSIDKPFMGWTTKDALDQSCAILAEMECGLQIRMMMPGSQAIPVWIYQSLRKPVSFDPTPSWHIKPMIDALVVLVTDRENAIRAQTRLALIRTYNGESYLYQDESFEALKALCDVTAMLSVMSALELGY